MCPLLSVSLLVILDAALQPLALMLILLQFLFCFGIFFFQFLAWLTHGGRPPLLQNKRPSTCGIRQTVFTGRIRFRLRWKGAGIAAERRKGRSPLDGTKWRKTARTVNCPGRSASQSARIHGRQAMYRSAPLLKQGALAAVHCRHVSLILNQRIQLPLCDFVTKEEGQQLHHIVIDQQSRLKQKLLHHPSTSIKPVGSLTSCQAFPLMLQLLPFWTAISFFRLRFSGGSVFPVFHSWD